MRKLFSVVGLFVLMMGLSVFSVAADHGASPSDSADSCAEAGGAFADLGSGVTSCVVISVEDVEVAASHKQQAWTAVIQVTTTTTYVTTTTTVPGELKCLNPGGQEMNLDHQHCNPNNLGQGWKLVNGPDTVVIEHSQSTDIDREQIGCNNHQGNAVTDWVGNKNCVPAA